MSIFGYTDFVRTHPEYYLDFSSASQEKWSFWYLCLPSFDWQKRRLSGFLNKINCLIGQQADYAAYECSIWPCYLPVMVSYPSMPALDVMSRWMKSISGPRIMIIISMRFESLALDLPF